MDGENRNTGLAGHLAATDMLLNVIMLEVFKNDLTRLDSMLESMIPPDELDDPVSESHRVVIKFHRESVQKLLRSRPR